MVKSISGDAAYNEIYLNGQEPIFLNKELSSLVGRNTLSLGCNHKMVQEAKSGIIVYRPLYYSLQAQDINCMHYLWLENYFVIFNPHVRVLGTRLGSINAQCI